MSDHVNPRFATRDQIAHMLRVTPRTLQKWQTQEGLPVIRIGKFRRYDPERVRAWMLLHEQRNVMQKAV